MKKVGIILGYLSFFSYICTMEKLYYIETKKGCVSKVIAKLKEHHLKTYVIEEHYENHYMNDGEIITWAESDIYPFYVAFGLRKTIKKCGIKIDL